MVRRTRAWVFFLVGTVAVPLGVASLAWACGPSGYGTPDSPSSPPASTAQPSTPAPSPVESGASTTSGAVGNASTGGGIPTSGGGGTSGGPPSGGGGPPSGGGGGPSGGGVPSGTTGSYTPANSGASARGTSGSQTSGSQSLANAPAGTAGQAAIAARIDGATAGVVRQGGRSVFASSTAPRSSARGNAAWPTSPRGWSGLASPSLDSAAQAGGTSEGLSVGLVAGSAILALGLVSLTGGALLVTVRRPRRAARIAGAPDRQSAEK